MLVIIALLLIDILVLGAFFTRVGLILVLIVGIGIAIKTLIG